MFPIKHVRSLDLLGGTPETPKEHCHKSRGFLMSPQVHEMDRCTPNQLEESRISCIGSRAIPHSTSYKTSVLTSFRQLQRCPETFVSSLEEHQFQHSNGRKAPCTPYCLEMRVDSQALTEEVSQLSTSISRGDFPQQYVREREPEFAA